MSCCSSRATRRLAGVTARLARPPPASPTRMVLPWWFTSRPPASDRSESRKVWSRIWPEGSQCTVQHTAVQCCMHLCERDELCEDEPDIDHLDVGSLGQGAGHADSTQLFQYNRASTSVGLLDPAWDSLQYSYSTLHLMNIVVRTSWLVRLTETIASKKNSLKKLVE